MFVFCLLFAGFLVSCGTKEDRRQAQVKGDLKNKRPETLPLALGDVVESSVTPKARTEFNELLTEGSKIVYKSDMFEDYAKDVVIKLEHTSNDGVTEGIEVALQVAIYADDSLRKHAEYIGQFSDGYSAFLSVFYGKPYPDLPVRAYI